MHLSSDNGPVTRAKDTIALATLARVALIAKTSQDGRRPALPAG